MILAFLAGAAVVMLARSGKSPVDTVKTVFNEYKTHKIDEKEPEDEVLQALKTLQPPDIFARRGEKEDLARQLEAERAKMLH